MGTNLYKPGLYKPEIAPDTLAIYRQALHALQDMQFPFLVGGAYALAQYAGIIRHTKDLDLFVRPGDAQCILDGLGRHGFRTELTFPHWLGKAHRGGDFVDVIFCSGNGIVRVDDEWFQHSVAAEVLGVPVHMIPAEEMIWSKGFIQERERFDGADIAHVIRSCGPGLDWKRLLRRFGSNWRVLFSHLVLFGFIYPDEQDKVPAWVVEELSNRLRQEQSKSLPREHLCQGTLLSREQYLPDILEWGYADSRLVPHGEMNEADVAHWTEAINQK